MPDMIHSELWVEQPGLDEILIGSSITATACICGAPICIRHRVGWLLANDSGQVDQRLLRTTKLEIDKAAHPQGGEDIGAQHKQTGEIGKRRIEHAHPKIYLCSQEERIRIVGVLGNDLRAFGDSALVLPKAGVGRTDQPPVAYGV